MNKIIEKIQNDKILKQIKPYLKDCQAYLVGGYLRDLFLGKSNPDRDIVIICNDIKQLTLQIARDLNSTHIELDKDWGIYRIVLPDKENYIDFAKATENNIEKDLQRRDLTLNSIAFDINKNKIIDINSGINDLKNKIIRGISEQNFTDDPLRILRAYRFQSCLGGTIETETQNWIKKHANLLILPAKERINPELMKLLEGGNAYGTFCDMDKNGVLEILFPFIKELKIIPKNSHHHLDLFNHSLETVRQIELNLPNLPEKSQTLLNEKIFGTVKKYAYLKLAAFMHDIGKPKTWKIEENTGRHRFIKHDSEGAEIAVDYLKSLKFSKKQISYIQKMIKNHIYPSNVNTENEKSVMKFLRRMKDDTPDILLLAKADRLSALGPEITQTTVKNNIAKLNFLSDKYFQNSDKLQPLPKLLSGNEIMEILSVPPSPLLGKIVSLLKEAQEDGEITTKAQAAEFVKNQYKLLSL